MKRYITIVLMALVLSGCLPEGDAGCPEYLTLRFLLEDEHQAGNFDDRIANDVLLYVFRDSKCIYRLLIPYQEILKNDGKFTFRKTFLMHGQIDLVAWTVAAGLGDPDMLPDWVDNTELDYLYLELPARTGPQDCTPLACELYCGTDSFREAVDTSSDHDIIFTHTACRVEVNVLMPPDLIVSDRPRVAVHGTMNRMDMKMKGIGEEAVVNTALNPVPGITGSYSTGRFGTLASKEYQTLAVEIYDGQDLLTVLKVPRDNLPRGASSGDLIIFDYELGDAEFWLTVNGFRQRIVIFEEM